MTCPKCDRPVIEATLTTGHKQLFDAAPDPEHGQTLILDGKAMYIQGTALFDARRMDLPVYARHAIHCRERYRRDA